MWFLFCRRSLTDWEELTFHMTLAVLGNYTGVILLISWPFVDVHGGVGRACIQNNSKLKHTEH